MADEKTLEQLKAQAYDCIAQVEFWQQKTKIANQAIANTLQKKEVKKEEPKK